MKRLFGATVLVSWAMYYALMFFSGTMERVDHLLHDRFDTLTQLWKPRTLHEPATVIVTIDEKSIAQLGQWPWSRIVIAKLLETLHAYKPAAITSDIIFPEPDRTSPTQIQAFYQHTLGFNVAITGIPDWLQDHDAIFAEAIRQSHITMPLYLQNTPTTHSTTCALPSTDYIQTTLQDSLYTAHHLLCNTAQLQDQAFSSGLINANADLDGIFRHYTLMMRYKKDPLASLSLATLFSAQMLQKPMTCDQNIWGPYCQLADHTIYTDQHTNVMLRFYNPSQYKTVSAVDLLNQQVSPQELLGKFIFIGATATGLYDHYIVASGEQMPGIFMHATFIENILNGDIISQPQHLKTINILVSMLASFLIIIFVYYKRFIAVVILSISCVTFALLATGIALFFNIYPFSGYFFSSFLGFFVLGSLGFSLFAYIQQKNFFERLGRSHQATLESMALVAETRDTETGAHIFRTKNYVKLLAQTLSKNDKYRTLLNTDFIEAVYYAAPLHDLGKVAIPDHILKKPARFTPEEFEIMKEHSAYGYDIINNAMKQYEGTMLLQVARNIAYTHHEKWDGTGYPQGLQGDAIPIEGRLMALADVYDALISKRYYKPSFTFEDAETIILEGRGTHFDPDIVDAFEILKERFREIAIQTAE